MKKQNEGLKAWQKLLGQIVGGVIFLVVYKLEGLPFTLNVFGWHMNVAWVYALFVLFWLIGFSNAVNLTDGIDGFLIKDRNVVQFAERVCQLIEDPKLLCKMSQSAIISSQRYSAKNIIPLWKTFFGSFSK